MRVLREPSQMWITTFICTTSDQGRLTGTPESVGHDPLSQHHGIGDLDHGCQINLAATLGYQDRHAGIKGGVFAHDRCVARHLGTVDVKPVAAHPQGQGACCGLDLDVPVCRPCLAPVKIGA